MGFAIETRQRSSLPHFIVPYSSLSVHWVTKIIYHSCYFTSLSNCLLFKQKGYLNCYVAQLFMPWHKNACLLLHGKVTHYNPSYHPTPPPPPPVVVGPSKCLSATSHQERGPRFSERAQRISAVAISLMSLTFALSLSLSASL